MPIPRLHLFEFNDQPWFPEVLRRMGTDYLRAAIALLRPFHPLAPRLAGLLSRAGTDHLVDLCSGGAGPYPALLDEVERLLGRPVTVTLTDRFPNVPAFTQARDAGRGRVDFSPDPVDVRAVPVGLAGVRTIFDGFHHFRPDDARAILEDAWRHRRPILVAEALSRDPRTLLGMVFVPLVVLALTPTLRPRTLSRFALTYLLPVAPVYIQFDGVVSCLRAWRPEELLAFTEGLDQGYRWEAGEVETRGQTVTFLIGEPTHE